MTCLRSVGLRIPTGTQKRIFWVKLVLFAFLLLGVASLRSITSPTTEPSNQASTSQDSAQNTQAATGIVLDDYMFSSTVPIHSSNWRVFGESPSRCNSGDCDYVEYDFSIIDAQGTSHEEKCAWDVDFIQRTATPRGQRAKWYCVRRPK